MPRSILRAGLAALALTTAVPFAAPQGSPFGGVAWGARIPDRRKSSDEREGFKLRIPQIVLEGSQQYAGGMSAPCSI